MLRLKDKQNIVAEVEQAANDASSIVAVDYMGLTSEQMTNLRAKAREQQVILRVVRNTLAKRALENTRYKCMLDVFQGPLLLAFAKEEPGSAAKLLRDFAKDHDKMSVKGLSLGDILLDKSQLDSVASLPTYEEALAKLLSVMLAPISKMVRTIAEPHAKLVRTVAAVRDKKQQ